MRTEEERLKTEYPGIVQQHNSIEFFTERVAGLKRITSIHMFPIEKAQFADFPIMCYDYKPKVSTLADLIRHGIELLPTEIKSIVWQLTKFMLHCQELAISHLRLCPEAIVLKEEFAPDRPIFIRVKDFSMGKEFETVAKGKLLGFFEYLHPGLSVGNGSVFFRSAYPHYDIWSLGVMLYRLIYKRSPFCKEGKLEFSKTILRKYLVEEYEVRYLSNKYASINLFIARCLKVGQKEGVGKKEGEREGEFRSWPQVMEWVVREEEIYNQLDFYDGHFQDMAEMHLRLMTLFSGIYCMIADQCRHSPHPFWHIPISADIRVPFHTKIAEFTLLLMKVHEDRFQRIYGPHLSLLRQKEMREAVAMVSGKLQVQLGQMGNRWTEKKFSQGQLTLEVIRVIQEVCVNLKMELSELGMPNSQRRISSTNSITNNGNRLRRRNSFKSGKVWRSMHILYDYCDEVIFIFNQCKNRMKHVFQQFYISKTFESILADDLGYKGILKVSLSEIMRRAGVRRDLQ